LDGFIGGAVDDFEPYGGERVGVFEVLLVQFGQARTPLGGVAVHDDVEDAVRASLRIAFLAADEGAVDPLARRGSEAQRTVDG
jgi:hypothetical protein